MLFEQKVSFENDFVDLVPENADRNSSFSDFQLGDLLWLQNIVGNIWQLLRRYQKQVANFSVLCENMLVCLQIWNPRRDCFIETDPEVKGLNSYSLILSFSTVFKQSKKSQRLLAVRNEKKFKVWAKYS